jgi:peptidyl-prolyl cis-trans isomerase B (cyclophilin B)
MYFLALLLSAWTAWPSAQAQRRPAAPPAAPAPFTTPLSAAQMTNKQAVVETTAGAFVIDLRPDLAPNHVGDFMKLAGEGAYANTAFHRVVRHAIIQGGDPLSKDPAKAGQVGTGGLGVLKAERSSEAFTRGAVGAALRPGQPDSGGAQFFVCVTDQPALAGQFTVFGRVSEGIDIVRRSRAPPTGGAPEARVAITAITIRDTPPPEPIPFANETPGGAAQHRAVLRPPSTITIAFTPGAAPETCATSRSSRRRVPTAPRSIASCGFVADGRADTRGPLTENSRRSFTTFSRSSTARSTKGMCPWRTIPPAPAPRLIGRQTRPRSTAKHRSSAGSSTARRPRQDRVDARQRRVSHHASSSSRSASRDNQQLHMPDLRLSSPSSSISQHRDRRQEHPQRAVRHRVVLEALKERGDVVSKTAYGDWTRAGDYSRSLTQHATSWCS